MAVVIVVVIMEVARAPVIVAIGSGAEGYDTEADFMQRSQTQKQIYIKRKTLKLTTCEGANTKAKCI